MSRRRSGSCRTRRTLSLSNTRFTGLPKWSFNLGANYEHKVGKVLESVGGFWDEQNYTAYGWWNLAFWDKVQFTNPWSLIQSCRPLQQYRERRRWSAHRRQALRPGALGEKSVRHALHRAERKLDARHRDFAGLLSTLPGAAALFRRHLPRATRRQDLRRLERRRNGSSEHEIALPGKALPWTGIYAGLNIGYGWGEPYGLNGEVNGGGQLGYNYQFTPLFVAGVEADIEGTGRSGPLGHGYAQPGRSLDYGVSFRGRVGVVARFKHEIARSTPRAAPRTRKCATTTPASTPTARVGSPGVGVEWLVTPAWSVKVEYLRT